jgi:methionyl aminopeptidase
VLKSPREIAKLRTAGRIVGRILAEMRRIVAPGVTTAALDARAEEMIAAAGARPLFKNYPHPSGPAAPPFPGVLCTSVNEVIVHGIPNDVPLREGDIVSIDCGVRLDGYVGDAAVTLPVGAVADDVMALMRHTEESLRRAIAQCCVGNRLGDIGHAVQSYVEPLGYGVVRDYCGHGVGRQMHEEPQVPNYGPPGRGRRLQAGLCIAIEPMVTLGTYETETLDDGWTVVTADRRPSAHFEHSVAITNDGPLILTTPTSE